jgi:hypothetical protein
MTKHNPRFPLEHKPDYPIPPDWPATKPFTVDPSEPPLQCRLQLDGCQGDATGVTVLVKERFSVKGKYVRSCDHCRALTPDAV